MTDYPPNAKPKEAPIPLRHMPQVTQAPLNPNPQIYFGPEPCTVTCPSCGASIVTTVTRQTNLIALLVCLICVCCACVPYCMNSCQSAEHHCPNCNAYLGTYKS